MSYEIDTPPLWPLTPNWKQNVVESLEFRTRVLGPTLTGLRQKRRMRIAPRRSFGFEVHPHHSSRRLLDNIRFAQGQNEWALPIWMDRQYLSASLVAGSSFIPCGTDGYDFSDGRYAVICKKSILLSDFELVIVDTVSPSGLTLLAPTSKVWPSGSCLFPVRLARLADGKNGLSLVNGEVSIFSVEMQVSEPCDWASHVFVDSYRGRPVWEFDTDWSSRRDFSMDRITSIVDNDTAIPSYFDFPSKTFIGSGVFWRAKDRPWHSLVRSVLYALAGRYVSLWLPTYTNDLSLTSDVEGSSSSIRVEYCGYTLFSLGREGRQDIRIELYDGSFYYRRILAAGEIGAEEQLVLDSPIGVSLLRGQVRRISFMSLVEQASDSVNITHLTDAEGVSTLPLVFEGVVEPPED